MTESGTTKSYGKGETIILDFASFTIDKVYIGKKRGVSISSENDLSYRGEPCHKVYLTEGESCEIHAQGKRAFIKLAGIVNR